MATTDTTAVEQTTAPAGKKGLSAQENATLKKMFPLSHLVFQNFNMTKMEANGFTLTMSPAIEELYKDDPEGKREAYERHNAFFNTHAVAFNFIAGLSYALERDAAQGNILGSLIFILFYGISQSVLKWFLLKTGYTLGTSFIDSVYNSGLMTVATKAASILGLTMVGAMTATTVAVPLNWTVHIGQTEIVVLDLFESIYPGILSVILVCVMLALIKKGVRPIWLIFGLIAMCMLGAALGVF